MSAPNQPSSAAFFAANSFYKASFDQSGAPANQTIVAAASNTRGIYIVAGQILNWVTASGTLSAGGQINFGGLLIPAAVDFIFDPYDGTIVGASNYAASIYAGANLITGLSGFGGACTVQFQCAYRVL